MRENAKTHGIDPDEPKTFKVKPVGSKHKTEYTMSLNQILDEMEETRRAYRSQSRALTG